MKFILDFEVTIDQQTRARDQTLEGVQYSGCPPVPAGQPRPYLVIFGPNFAKSLSYAFEETIEKWLRNRKSVRIDYANVAN